MCRIQGYYSAVVVVALATGVIMCAAVRDSTVIGRREKRLFWALFCSAGAASLCEWCSVALDGRGLAASTFIPMLRLVEHSLFVLIDVDLFKQVNDEHRYTAGDRVFQVIGGAIHQVYSKFGMCFRSGGDEFFVILTEDLERIEAFNRELRRLLDEQRRDLPYLPTVSIGFAEYDPRRTSKEKAIATADEMMYRWKRSRRTAAE